MHGPGKVTWDEIREGLGTAIVTRSKCMYCEVRLCCLKTVFKTRRSVLSVYLDKRNLLIYRERLNEDEESKTSALEKEKRVQINSQNFQKCNNCIAVDIRTHIWSEMQVYPSPRIP